MVRPKGSSPKSYRRIYYRLLKGPLCLEDYRSTGLKSRSTVNNRLKHLLKLGLVKQFRDGHKRPYILNGNKGMKDWLPILTNEKEWREINKPSGDLKQWALNFINFIRPKVKVIQKIRSVINESAENEKIIECIHVALQKELKEKRREKIETIDILELWHKYEIHQICRECLRNKKKIVFTRQDSETMEIYCPECGIVQETPRFTTFIRKRASPFPLPE